MAIDITKLEEGLENLRGFDYEAAAARVRKTGNNNILLKADERFQAELASMALQCHVADIRELPLKKYSHVIQKVFNFLFELDSTAEENSEP